MIINIHNQQICTSKLQNINLSRKVASLITQFAYYNQPTIPSQKKASTLRGYFFLMD